MHSCDKILKEEKAQDDVDADEDRCFSRNDVADGGIIPEGTRHSIHADVEENSSNQLRTNAKIVGEIEDSPNVVIEYVSEWNKMNNKTLWGSNRGKSSRLGETLGREGRSEQPTQKGDTH